ncbi:MAG: hypothetical protein WAU21_04000, partial [Chitinophagales bacterium]
AKPFNKQIKVIYLFIVIFSLFIFSCNKVSLIQPTTQESTYTFEQLISDPNFPAEELSNKKLSEIIQTSYSYFMSNHNRQKVLDNFSTDFKLTSFISQLNLSIENQDELTDSVSIYIPNLYTANLDLNPIFCVGTELNSELNLDSLNDYIPGWYYTEDSIYNEILLNENSALSEERMVIIYNYQNSESQSEESGNLEMTQNNTLKEGNITTAVPYINSFLIDYRYESSGDSEYNMRIVTVYSGGYTTLSDKYHIKDVKPSDIGNIIYDDYQMDYSPSILSQYIVFYEHDWYAPYQTVFISGGPLGSVAIKVRMVNSNEWYQKVWLDFSGSAWQTFYSKGFVDIHVHL